MAKADPDIIGIGCLDGSNHIQRASFRTDCDDLADALLYKHGIIRPCTPADPELSCIINCDLPEEPYLCQGTPGQL